MMCDSDSFVQNNVSISDKVKHFEENVLFNPQNKGKTVYMLFKADWCGACKKYKPVFLRYRDVCKEKSRNDMIMVVIDVDSAPDLSKEYEVQGLPTTYVYKVDDQLLGNKDNKLSLYREKIVGCNEDSLKRAMNKYSGI